MASRRGTAGTPLGRPVALAKKRRAAESKDRDKVTLQAILGITCYSGSGLSTSESCIAYPAGCVAVLFHPKGKGKQVHIHNRKPISCLCISPHGSYLATGESGHEPCVRVWDLRSPQAISQVARLKEHEFGVQCVAFSPSGKQLVSVGYKHDRQIIVWNWKAGAKLVHGKFSSEVNGISFSLNHGSKVGSSYFVTVHNRRVQFWYYNSSGKEMNTTMSLKSRSAVLGELHKFNFVAVSCGRGDLAHYTYALTRTGQLCLFGKNRTLEKFTDTKAPPAYSLALSDQFLFCGCSDGVIRIFDPQSLDYVTTMPRPHSLGINLSSIDNTEKPETDKNNVYPDAIALTVHHNRLSVVYNDHSIFVWDLSNMRQIGVLHSFLFHSAGVWDICTYPTLSNDSAQLLPPSCFITCSSDSTVRFWSMGAEQEGAWSHRTAYSKELLRIIYCEPEDKLSLKDTADLPGRVTSGNKGVKCIQVRPDGQHIATGDRIGNLAVYDLQFLDLVYREIAHDLDILSLSYSPVIDNQQFLSSASRDRMMHVFSLGGGGESYEAIQTLSDHSAAVTSVRFVRGSDGTLHLLSSGADKSLIFHSMEKSQGESACMFHRTNNVVSKATIFDMDIDVLGKHVVTAGQDRVLRFYLVNGGKQKTVIKAPPTDSEGGLLKVSLDPSGLLAASSCADKSVLIFDVFSGECVAKLAGHSEVVTQVRFSQDCRFLYSVSGDSCIFVWRLSKKLTQAMHSRLSELGLPLPPGQETPPTSPHTARQTFTKIRTSTPHAPRVLPPRNIGTDVKDVVLESVDSVEPDFEYRMSMLPSWAQREAVGGIPSVGVGEGTEQMAAPVEGRWAERVAGEELKLAVQEQDSDVDLEDLSSEMSRIVFEKQSSVTEVIDLTEDDDENVLPDSHVIDNEGHVTEEANESKSSDGSDVLKFYTSSLSDEIDPSIFCVTTPIKPSDTKDESEDDESPRESPIDSPVPLNKILEEEESSFLKAHFESLEKSGDPQLLKVPSPRQSISAKFKETLRKVIHVGDGGQVGLGESPPLSEAAGIVISVEDSTSPADQPQDDSQTTPMALLDGGAESPDIAAAVDTVTHKIEYTDKSMKRRLSFETDVAKTRQKLVELGYSVESRKQIVTATEPSPSPSVEQLLDNSPPLHPASDGPPSGSDGPPSTSDGPPSVSDAPPSASDGPPSVSDAPPSASDGPPSVSDAPPSASGGPSSVSKKTVSIKPRANKKPPSPDSDSDVRARLSSITDGLDANFRALMELHDQVVASGSGDATSDDVATSIATYLTTLKSNVVSVVNKNRQMWREKMITNLSENPIPEIEVVSESAPELLNSNEETSFEQGGVADVCEGGDSCEECDDSEELTLRITKEEYDKCILANELLTSFVTALSVKEQLSECDT